MVRLSDIAPYSAAIVVYFLCDCLCLVLCILFRSAQSSHGLKENKNTALSSMDVVSHSPVNYCNWRNFITLRIILVVVFFYAFYHTTFYSYLF